MSHEAWTMVEQRKSSMRLSPRSSFHHLLTLIFTSLLLLLLLLGCGGRVDSIVPATAAAAAPGKGGLPEELYNAVMLFEPNAVEIAMAELRRVLRAEARHAAKMRKRAGRKTGRRNGNSFHFVQTFMGSTPYAKQLSYPSFMQTVSLSAIRKQFSMTNTEVRQLLELMPKMLQQNPYTMLERDVLPQPNPLQCPYPINVACSPHALYRMYDGRCNNLLRPLWGSSHQPLGRFLPPDYADAISSPRVSRSGYPLPSARLVSAVIHWDFDIPHHMHTLMLMQVGQFVDHDMTRTAITKMAVNAGGFGTEMEDVECGYDGCQTDGLENRACFPIFVSPNDTDFGHQRRCLMFVRSQEAPNDDCVPGPREQINQLTSYLDASHIYGSTEKDALEIRDLTPHRGLMKVTAHPAGGYKPMLPLDPNAKDCRGDNRTIFCFKAGDGRVNEFSGITTQHAVWMREHNHIERTLHKLNPHWDGERLYQETRRIVIALWQFAVYNEYLPIILGPDAMRAHGLQLVSTGYWNGYDETVKPNIANSFATAAMRFGHTQLQGMIRGRDAGYNVISNIALSTQLRRPHVMYEEPHKGMDMMMLGMIGESTQNRDQFITKQVSRHLFSENPPHELGEDLMSLNIQRSRDHGIPGYNYFREWCGLKRGKTFSDLVELPINVIKRFRLLYEHVDDIDLWPAGISEDSFTGTLLGPTFTCILARQFHNLKFGDRFWFENSVHNPYPFTKAQLAEIRKFRYAKLLCANADFMPHIQPNVFFHPLSVVNTIVRHQDRPVNVDDIDYFYSQSSNERVPCDALPDIDLQPWAEAPPSPPVYPPAPQAPGYVEPRQAAELLPIASKTAGTAVERFLKEIASDRRKPVFRKHGQRV